MKFVIVLCILSALLLQIDGTPVKLAERNGRAVSRQQSTAANEIVPAAAPADEDDEDDDEDDDDDDGDIGDIGDLVDDDEEDDDDEEEDDDDEEDDTPQGQAAPAAGAADDDEEDDDEDDYLDRLFDDILGDDDDEDDDDDDVSPAASVQNTIAAAQSPSASVVDDIAPVGQAAAGTGISDGVDLPLDSANAADSSAANIADDGVAAATTNNKNEGAVAANTAADEAEETEDDDDDDDDDDIIGDDVIEARREARALKNNIIDMSQDAFQERHNHFIDSIFDRINRMVSDNYDPFVVRLNARAELKDATASVPVPAATSTTKATATKTKTTTTTTTTTNANKTKSSKKKRKNANRTETRALKDTADVNDERKASDISAAAQTQKQTQNKLQQQMEQLQQEQLNLKAVDPMDTFSAADKNAKPTPAKDTTTTTSTTTTTGEKDQKLAGAVGESESPEVRTVFTNESGKGGGHHKKSSTKTHKSKGKPQKLKQANTPPNHSGKVADKYQNAEGSLSGLSSLKRVGNVKVTSDPEGRNSTIKAKFTLGPLILRVEKSIKRGGVRNVKSATARTNEMIGRIKFSVVNDNATLMSIKVQQPKQVEVESKDNHDHTRELVWRRTPKIAKLVNEKLKMAVESILTPQTRGVEVVRL